MRKKNNMNVCFILGLMGCFSQLCAQESEMELSIPTTYRMNQNIHYIPEDDSMQQALIDRYIETGYGGFSVNVSYDDYLTNKGMEAFKSFCNKEKATGLELLLYETGSRSVRDNWVHEEYVYVEAEY